MKIIIFLLFILVQFSFPQQKYFIYFTDKGNQSTILTKGSAEYTSALSELTERSIERRKRNFGDDIVTFGDIPVKKEYIDSLTVSGIEIIHVLKWFNAVSARLTRDQLETLKHFSFIEKIELIKTFKTGKYEGSIPLMKSGAPDSAFYGTSYTQLRMSDIPRVHGKNITGKGVLLGVLDTGFKWKNHEATMNADVIAEYDFIFNDSITENQTVDVPTQHNHGTSVFSIISGKKDSVLIGSAYGAQFILAKTEDVRSETRLEEDNYAAALEWMENYGVDITTSSLGYSEFDNFDYSYSDMDGKTTIVTLAAEYAFKKGVLVITSAGNEGNKPWHYITAPADGYNVIAVGAVNSNNKLASFSGRGPTYDGRIKPEIVAMGVSVFGASPAGAINYGFYEGTSLAAPVAAGAAALLLSAHPYLTNVQLREIIIRTASNYNSPNNDRGYGMILAGNAIEYPNLEQRDAACIVNKIFLGDQVSNVKLYFSGNSTDFTEMNLASDSYRYTFELPAEFVNRVVKFYYTYADSGGNLLRAPEKGYYTAVYGDLTSVKVEDDVPADYILSNNYPNPFNSFTRINFIVKDNSDVRLDIYDALGQKVKTLYNAANVSGQFSIIWNGRSDNGLYCSSGIYIYHLKIAGSEIAKKMVLLK